MEVWGISLSSDLRLKGPRAHFLWAVLCCEGLLGPVPSPVLSFVSIDSIYSSLESQGPDVAGSLLGLQECGPFLLTLSFWFLSCPLSRSGILCHLLLLGEDPDPLVGVSMCLSLPLGQCYSHFGWAGPVDEGRVLG